MKTTINREELDRLRLIKARIDNLNSQIDELVDEASDILGETAEEFESGLAFDSMLNRDAAELESLLERFGVKVQG